MKRTALALTTLTLTALSQAQNTYEIYLSSFANARELKGVNFQLYQGDKLMAEQQNNAGFFQFVIMEGDDKYKLTASKEGYIPKLIIFNTSDYPFLHEYEIQEIDIEFHKVATGDEKTEIGELMWSSVGHVFSIVKFDSTRDVARENYTASEKSLAEIYQHSIAKGDELMMLKLPQYSLAHYVTALMAKPNDDYAKKKIMEIKEGSLTEMQNNTGLDNETMDKINRGELTQMPGDIAAKGIVFSVQLGAFSREVSDAEFAQIPEFRKIRYDDYTRIFSGEFSEVASALARKVEMISRGYKDAWIVQMKGHERIGF